MNTDKQIDDILCRITTGYTRKELLEFSEEDTGLDKYEVQDELKSVDRAKAAIKALLTAELAAQRQQDREALLAGLGQYADKSYYTKHPVLWKPVAPESNAEHYDTGFNEMRDLATKAINLTMGDV